MSSKKLFSKFLAKYLLVSTAVSCFGCYAYAMEKTKASFRVPNEIKFKALEGAKNALKEIYPKPVYTQPRGNEIMSTILEYVFCRIVDRRLKDDGKFPEIDLDFVYEMRVWLTARDENDPYFASALASGSGWDKLYPPFIGPALWFLNDQVENGKLWDGYNTFVRNYQKNHTKELEAMGINLLG